MPPSLQEGNIDVGMEARIEVAEGFSDVGTWVQVVIVSRVSFVCGHMLAMGREGGGGKVLS